MGHEALPFYIHRARSFGRDVPFVVLTRRPQPERAAHTLGKRIFMAAGNEAAGPRS